MTQHRLRVADAIFDTFPETFLAIVTVRGINNLHPVPAITARLRAAEAAVRGELAGAAISEHPAVAPWREAYRAFGAKPKDYPSSIENLLRRVLKGQTLREISPLVDLYNAISLEHLVPAGGEDLDAVRGEIRLTFAGDAEPAVRLLGEPEERAPRPGEVIYTDDAGALCRRWNWKEAERTKLTNETRNALLVIETVSQAGAGRVQAAAGALAAAVEEYLGGSVGSDHLDRGRRLVTL